jgi:flagellar biosynthesis/type III secretory pathway protein FliH
MGFQVQARHACLVLLLAVALAAPVPADAQGRKGRQGDRRPPDKTFQQPRADDAPGRRLAAGLHEPAYARGYDDGFQEGRQDARHRDRYDPVGTRDYRNGDQGYSSDYGSRDSYKNNYRAGFRQGYEHGYRSVG